MAEYTTVYHTIPPLWAADSRVLVLGSFPSPKSREAAFFYGHPRNRFWPVLAAVLGEEAPANVEEKRAMVLRHYIAMWDTLYSCEIKGASDTSIRHPVANDLSSIIERSQIKAVFCTGGTSYKYYVKLCESLTGIRAVCLPSTSPANAAWSFERLVEAYRVIPEALYKD
ncbi:MAG: DNA-deoxyinosine glycosylase [Lachnospiraceae bacterium]|nr:DNA-deoxyinosine glycosylase [Lachnospiraceae bacterium]